MTLRLDSGSTTYLADDLGGVAGLVAQDGGFDFSALDEEDVERIYLAGEWYLSRHNDAPGVSALRDDIREGRRPYLVFNVRAEQDFFGLDIGGASFAIPAEGGADMRTAADAFVEFDRFSLDIRINRFPEWFQLQLRRELYHLYGDLLNQFKRTEGVAEIVHGCGYLLPLRGYPGDFRAAFLDKADWGLRPGPLLRDAASVRETLQVWLSEYEGLFDVLLRHGMLTKALVLVVQRDGDLYFEQFDSSSSPFARGICTGHSWYDGVKVAAILISGDKPTASNWVSPFVRMVDRIRSARWR